MFNYVIIYLILFQVTSKLIRALFTVTLVCQTMANKHVNKGEESTLTRDDISCLMIYAANGKSNTCLVLFVCIVHVLCILLCDIVTVKPAIVDTLK